MARIRTLKPEFFRSRSLAQCSVEARLTFAGLWTEADDHGRGIADPRILKGALWPLDDDVTHEHVSSHIRMLVATGHIRLYEADGETYFEIINWEDHQAAAYRRGEPKYPAPETYLGDVSHGRMKESEGGTQERAGIRNEEQGTGNEEQGVTSDEPDVSEQAHDLTDTFIQAVQANGHPVPSSGTKARRTWLVEMDRLLRLGPPGEGGHIPDPQEVATVIGWCAADTGDDRYPGESVNVRSVPKFRERYSQLRGKALSNGRSRASPQRVSTDHVPGRF